MKISGSAVLAIALVGGLIYLLTKHSDLFNPASQNNLANTGFNDLYQTLTGSQGTFGSDLYGLLHPNEPGSSSTTPNMCFVYDANGVLQYSNGEPSQATCGTTTSQGTALTGPQLLALRNGGG